MVRPIPPRAWCAGAAQPDAPRDVYADRVRGSLPMLSVSPTALRTTLDSARKGHRPAGAGESDSGRWPEGVYRPTAARTVPKEL